MLEQEASILYRSRREVHRGSFQSYWIESTYSSIQRNTRNYSWFGAWWCHVQSCTRPEFTGASSRAFVWSHSPKIYFNKDGHVANGTNFWMVCSINAISTHILFIDSTRNTNKGTLENALESFAMIAICCLVASTIHQSRAQSASFARIAKTSIYHPTQNIKTLMV